MSLIKQLEPAYISFYVTFNQVETAAKSLIQNAIGAANVPLKIEAEEIDNCLRILLHIDYSFISNDDAGTLSQIGFEADTPYNNGDRVISEIFNEFSEIEIQPLTGEDEEWGTYFVVQLPFSTNNKLINISLNL